MKYKAYDLMKAAKENPEKYKDKRYRVVGGTAIDHSGSESKEIQFCTTGQMSTGIFVAYVSSDTVLEEIKPEPKPVPFMEAREAFENGKVVTAKFPDFNSGKMLTVKYWKGSDGTNNSDPAECDLSFYIIRTAEWFIKE